MENNNKNLNLIPGAIIAAGLLIAGAIFYSNQNNPSQKSVALNNQNKDVSFNDDSQKPKEKYNSVGSNDLDDINIKPVDSEDHIFGNREAPIKVVEFSDLECPFCKKFHQTMRQIVEEYGGTDGQIAWVYRHFPLTQIHSKAPKEAEAAECANELGGNDKFWQYIDKIFEITPSNNGLDLKLLPQVAEDIGLNRQQFEICLESGKYAGHIDDDARDAVTSGARGTPFSIVIAQNNQKFIINGAQPLSAVKAVIESALTANK